jgi:hypothetical protein
MGDIDMTEELTKALQASLKRLQMADQAPRCNHIKADGVRCGSPRLKGHNLCYAHYRMAAAPQGTKLGLPPLEDANGVQLAIMDTIRAFLDGELDHKSAALLFYALQVASSNLRWVHFEPLFHSTLARELPAEQADQPARAKHPPQSAGSPERAIQPALPSESPAPPELQTI